MHFVCRPIAALGGAANTRYQEASWRQPLAKRAVLFFRNRKLGQHHAVYPAQPTFSLPVQRLNGLD